MGLTNEEKETTITFDETPGNAVVLTYSKKWQTQIEKKLGIKPDLVNGYGGKEYSIPKKRIRMPLAPRIMTPEAKKKASERLKKLHRNPKIGASTLLV